MKTTLAAARLLFMGLCTVLMITYTSIGGATPGLGVGSIVTGLLLGGAFCCCLLGVDTLMRWVQPRSLNLITLGLFVGYVLGSILNLLVGKALAIVAQSMAPEAAQLLEMAILLTGTYMGLIVTIRGSEQLAVSLPFIKLQAKQERQAYFLLDASVLADPRIIDLATSGILDERARIARFVVRDLQKQLDVADEQQRNQARKALEVIKKLEELPHLGLDYENTDYPELGATSKKLMELARQRGATILTADMNRIEMSSVDTVRIVNIHQLSNALKPLTQAGECIQIKIQRPGKEPRQGVGYLDDGTMVVINGGGDYIGETIRAQVLSVKHTSSGRMVFCNALEKEHAPALRGM